MVHRSKKFHKLTTRLHHINPDIQEIFREAKGISTDPAKIQLSTFTTYFEAVTHYMLRASILVGEDPAESYVGGERNETATSDAPASSRRRGARTIAIGCQVTERGDHLLLADETWPPNNCLAGLMSWILRHPLVGVFISHAISIAVAHTCS